MKIESIIHHLASEMQRALEAAFRVTADTEIPPRRLLFVFREA